MLFVMMYYIIYIRLEYLKGEQEDIMLFAKNELSAAEQMLDYMKKKYKEDFTPGLCQGANWAYSYDSMTVFSEKFPKEFIQVYRYDNKIFKDNYMSFLFREEIEKMVFEIVEPLFGKCVVIMHVSNFPVHGNLSKEASVNDYLKNSPASNSFSIYLEGYNPSKDYMLGIEELRLRFKDKLLPGIIDLWFLKQEKCLEEITRKTEFDVHCDIDEDSWFEKDAHFCFFDNYEFDESELGQL